MSGSEKSRLNHDRNQQRSTAMFIMMAFSLNTCTQPGTPLINGFVDAAPWNPVNCTGVSKFLKQPVNTSLTPFAFKFFQQLVCSVSL